MTLLGRSRPGWSRELVKRPPVSCSAVAVPWPNRRRLLLRTQEPLRHVQSNSRLDCVYCSSTPPGLRTPIAGPAEAVHTAAHAHRLGQPEPARVILVPLLGHPSRRCLRRRPPRRFFRPLFALTQIVRAVARLAHSFDRILFFRPHAFFDQTLHLREKVVVLLVALPRLLLTLTRSPHIPRPQPPCLRPRRPAGSCSAQLRHQRPQAHCTGRSAHHQRPSTTAPGVPSNQLTASPFPGLFFHPAVGNERAPRWYTQSPPAVYRFRFAAHRRRRIVSD